jgi:hypothetical protein
MARSSGDRPFFHFYFIFRASGVREPAETRHPELPDVIDLERENAALRRENNTLRSRVDVLLDIMVKVFIRFFLF